MEGKVFNLLVGSLIFLRKKRRLTVSRARQVSFYFIPLSLKTFGEFSYGNILVIILILSSIHFSHFSLPNKQRAHTHTHIKCF